MKDKRIQMNAFVEAILGRLKVKYTHGWLDREIKSNPFVQSMYGLSHLLTEYDIENECVRLTNKRDLCSITETCIIIYKGRYAIASCDGDKGVTLLFSSNCTEDGVAWQEFEKNWDGVVLLATPSTNSIEPEYEVHVKECRLTLVKKASFTICIVLAVIIGAMLNPLSVHLTWYCLLVLNWIGIGISCLLLQKDLRIQNKLADRICGLLRNNNCETVTESQGATFIGIAKLSEIGGGFFIVNVLVLLYAPSMVDFMAWSTICTLPFTIWSLLYQKFYARNWCVLCLLVLILLWSIAIVCLLTGYLHLDSENWIESIMLLSLYGIATLLIGFAMNIIRQKRSGEQWRHRFIELKSNDKVIDAIAGEKNQFETSGMACSSMVFGNPNASNSITIFSNPYCNPCASMHERVKNLPSDNVSIRYVMLSFSDELNSTNRYIIASYQQLGPMKTWTLLTQWYNGGKDDKDGFFGNLKLDIMNADVEMELSKQLAWKNENRIEGTPTVIVNGRKIVAPYSVEDYWYL